MRPRAVGVGTVPSRSDKRETFYDARSIISWPRLPSSGAVRTVRARLLQPVDHISLRSCALYVGRAVVRNSPQPFAQSTRLALSTRRAKAEQNTKEGRRCAACPR